MHGAAFILIRAGRGEEKNFGVGQGGAWMKSSWRGDVTVKIGAFLGWGGAVLKIFRAGAAIFPGAGACIPD